MILPIIESFVLCFTLLLICVLNVRNTPVGGVHFYEKDVQERTIELGLITREEIKKNKVINVLAAASFPTYLIHINLLEYFNIPAFVQRNTGVLILHIIGTTLAIYLISFVIYEIYNLITKPLFKVISGKWQKRRYIDLSDQK